MKYNSEKLKSIYLNDFKKMREDIYSISSLNVEKMVMIKNLQIDFDRLDRSFKILYSDCLLDEKGGLD